jgi:hypothetical protein
MVMVILMVMVSDVDIDEDDDDDDDDVMVMISVYVEGTKEHTFALNSPRKYSNKQKSLTAFVGVDTCVTVCVCRSGVAVASQWSYSIVQQ